MTATQTTEAPARKKVAKKSAPKKAKVKKAAAAPIDMKGIYHNTTTGKYEVNFYFGGYDTAEEAFAARQYALEAKRAYKAGA